jgi:hypothetical protein
MSFIFNACFNETSVVKDFTYEKEYDPRVSLIRPISTKIVEQPAVSQVVGNKFKGRGYKRRGETISY